MWFLKRFYTFEQNVNLVNGLKLVLKNYEKQNGVNCKTRDTLLLLAISYRTSDHARNVPLSEKGDSRMAQGLECMLGVNGVQTRQVL